MSKYAIARIDKGLINGLYVQEEYNHSVLINVNTFKNSSYSILHGNGLPAVTTYYDDGTLLSELYYKDGELHRENDLPSIIYYSNGKPTREYWHKHGQLHRDNDMPANILYDTYPALRQLTYYINGRLHSTTHPAIINYAPNGKIKSQCYLVEGVQLTKEKFLKQYFPIEHRQYLLDKTYNINAKKYKIVNTIGKQIVLEEI